MEKILILYQRTVKFLELPKITPHRGRNFLECSQGHPTDRFGKLSVREALNPPTIF